jgi:hypothetical protein
MSGGYGVIDSLSERERELVLLWLRTYDRQAFDKAVKYVESKRKPPRIPEPTEPLSKVTAETKGRERREFIRGVGGIHRWVDGTASYAWSELIDPMLIREALS